MDRGILVVDDSMLVCQQLSQLLAAPGRSVTLASSVTEALEWLVDNPCSLVLTDLRLPDVSGLELIKLVHERKLPVTVIVMTGYATVENAVEAMRLGAYDFIPKPIDPVHLELVVNKALDDRGLTDELEAMRARLKRKNAYHNLVGKSPVMLEVFDRVARVAGSSCNVLVTGETGTGKELVAQAIHSSDVKRRGPLVAVNCAALPESLLETELFGCERGAFTGADRQRKGRFELADGGTLFLDEIGEMPIGMQSKLLRVLQDGRFDRVGGGEPVQTDCRVVAATNVNLAEAVAQGRFREDLFYRLNVFSIELPPLRDRLEDIPLLIEELQGKMAERGIPVKTVSRMALKRLLTYDWPGNVRELEHVLEQAAVTTPGSVIEPENLPSQIVPRHDEPFSLDFDLHKPLPEITAELTARIERAYLQLVLERNRGRIELCARQSGLSRRSISEKLRRYQIDKANFKPHSRSRRSLELSA